MRKVYPIHVIKEKKIVIKDEYLGQKSKLVFLPDVKEKTKRSRKTKKDARVTTNTAQTEDERLIQELELLHVVSASNTSTKY